MEHTLKILPAYYEAVWRGEKTFEIRDNTDRGFQKGDKVILREYDPSKAAECHRWTNREIEKTITYVTNYEQRPGWVVFSIQ